MARLAVVSPLECTCRSLIDRKLPSKLFRHYYGWWLWLLSAMLRMETTPPKRERPKWKSAASTEDMADVMSTASTIVRTIACAEATVAITNVLTTDSTVVNRS